LEPFEEHPADPAAIRASGEELMAVARTMIDQESLMLQVFTWLPAHWSGVASEELRHQPAPVRRAAQESVVRHSWAGAVLGYWAEQVESFNNTVSTIRTTLNFTRSLPFFDPEVATANARRDWRTAHEKYIVDGGERTAQMFAEGPTSANIAQMREFEVLPAGRDGVFPDLWQELYPPTSDEVRLLNFNIGMGYEDTFGNERGTEPEEIGRIARMIANSNADIVTLQEVWGLESVLGDERRRGLLESELERLTGRDWQLYYSHTVDTKLEDGDGHVLEPDIPYGHLVAVQYGEGVTGSERLFDERISVEANEDRRALGLQVQTEGGGQLNVVNTHISTQDGSGSSDGEQARQIDAIHDTVRNDGVPTVVAGDFNQDPETSGAGAEILDFVRDGYVDTGNDERATHEGGHIDHVLAEGGLRPNNVRIIEGDPDGSGGGSELSDHDGILVDLEVPSDR
jgi:endonuclease/exonuclease/phosphatase family metal-dependent hydrolase